MNERYLAKHDSNSKFVVIQCVEVVNAFDVRHFAAKHLQLEGAVPDLALTEDPPTVWLRWTGSDAGAYPNKRLQVREQEDGDWKDA